MSDSEYKRVKCPKCDNENPRMLHEEPDKNSILYYSMQGNPVYARQIKCGKCGEMWGKSS